MTESRVPSKLVDCILKNLYFDTPTLLNCALVGRAWVRSSQHGIFREIVLELPFTGHSAFATLMDAYLKTARHFNALFSEKPYLASYVRLLELRSSGQYKVPMPKVVYTATASLVQRLSEVKELKFHDFGWNTLPPLLKAVLTELCKAPSVTQFSATKFDITTFTELASLLSNMKNLKVLDVNVAYRNGTVPRSLTKSETKPRCIQLSDLRLINSYSHNGVRPLMTWFQQDWCPFEVRHLNSLETTTRVNMATLQYCCTNLRELKLKQHRSDESMHVQTTNYMLSLQLTTLVGFNTKLDHLGYTPNLRSLSLMSLMSSFEPSLHNPTTWIQSLFKPLLNPDGNPFPLQHLTLSLPIRIRPPRSDPHYWDQWTAIDVLLGKPEFALLETVDFKLSAPLGFPEIPDGARQLLREKLPFLETSGKLRVQIVNN
ncbi:hypothetical protein BT96DRAFT_995451 [Gymnopus androsaceus JB14]|uniref:F-box domain-containing protein n=1 Tax=Gymnopus androsaceus JB14 TaxID=1447944 RepID=A0A6A4HJL7_9AGAR|nr:hypothetical protein BT96DRAFT_995451 [Gymnopus androsaceus JB14]